MTDAEPWPDEPPPNPAARRFQPGMVWAGAALGVVLTVGLTLLGVGVAGESTAAGSTVTLVGLLGALVGGTVIATIPGPPARRGLGLGLVIGWGISLVLAGGLCVVLLATYASTG